MHRPLLIGALGLVMEPLAAGAWTLRYRSPPGWEPAFDDDDYTGIAEDHRIEVDPLLPAPADLPDPLKMRWYAETFSRPIRERREYPCGQRIVEQYVTLDARVPALPPDRAILRWDVLGDGRVLGTWHQTAEDGELDLKRRWSLSRAIGCLSVEAVDPAWERRRVFQACTPDKCVDGRNRTAFDADARPDWDMVEGCDDFPRSGCAATGGHGALALLFVLGAILSTAPGARRQGRGPEPPSR